MVGLARSCSIPFIKAPPIFDQRASFGDVSATGLETGQESSFKDKKGLGKSIGEWTIILSAACVSYPNSSSSLGFSPCQ